MASVSTSADHQFNQFPEQGSSSKQSSSEFDRLRYELKSYGEESRSDSLVVNSQEVIIFDWILLLVWVCFG